MPVYDFVCDKCGKKNSVVQSLTETDKEVRCECGELMRRDFGFAATQFKGSGFYTTDKNRG